ncbi:MAG: hypothetical protein CVU80_02555, partial [Elusimicrobia bacterium HGW-Elusimicrobia-4]
LSMLTAMVGLAIVNAVYGIQQIGLVPRTILQWPLNAAIAWIVSIGSAMGIATLLWWDISLKKNISLLVYAIFAEALFSTVSLLSRGVYIFHTIPQMLSLYKNSSFIVRISRKKVALLVVAFISFFIISLSVTSTYRAYLYPNIGDFTSKTQSRLIRLEVLDGGIAHVKELMDKGAPLEKHLRDLIEEKANLINSISPAALDEEITRIDKRIFTTKNNSRLIRLEVLDGGIAHVKELIDKGEPLEKHLCELTEEKANLMKLMASITVNGKISEADISIQKGEPLERRLRELVEEKDNLIKRRASVMVNGKISEADELIHKRESAKSTLHETATDTIVPGKRLTEGNAEKKEIMKIGTPQYRMLFEEFGYQMKSGFFERIIQLGVDRWIGLEGVMAIRSYSEKGGAIFLKAMTEKRELGKVTLYQEVCKSSYRYTDTSKWQFASLPGAVAFLYYSGSLWVVMLGMVVFSLLVLLIEHVVDMLTDNPLLCSLIGFGVANSVAQFGLSPLTDLPYFFMIFCGILAIWFVQSRFFFRLLQKLDLFGG